MRRQDITPLEAFYVKGPFKLSPGNHRLFLDDKEIYLTKSEFIIFRKLLENSNCIVSQNALSRVLWGDELPESIEAIRVYISRMRQKIEPCLGEPQYILTKPGIGYCLKLAK